MRVTAWLASRLGVAARALVPRAWHRSTRVARQLLEKCDGRVLSGPFAGCRYVSGSHGSTYWPKLLGTYECELHELIEEILGRGFSRALIAGAAEGYYAAGLAIRSPRMEVVAWEASPVARELLGELLAKNGVGDRVRVREICTVGELARELGNGEGTFLLVDIEGAEAILIDPALLDGLSRAELLIETHDPFVPGVEALLTERFAATHHLRWIAPRPRRVEEIAPHQVAKRFHGALVQLMDERRPSGIRWLHLRPR